MNVFTTFSKARRTMRGIALAMAVLFLNLMFTADFARLAAGEGFALQGALAQATASRRIGVFVLPSTDAAVQTAQVLNSILRENTRQLGDVRLVTGVTAAGEELLPQIVQLADKGYDQLNARDNAGALATFAQAYKLVERAQASIERRLHARVLKGYGVARFFAGEEAPARDLVKKALLVFPKQSAAEYDYSLEAKNLYRDVRRELQDEATGTIEVTSEPAGAEVHVDHYLKGYTTAGEPLVLQNLQAGPHFVRLLSGGYEVWTGYVELEPAGKASVDAKLVQAPNGRRFQALLDDSKQALRTSRGVDPALKGLRSFLGATELLVVLAGASAEGFELKGFYLPPEGEMVPVEESVVQDATLYQNLRDLTAITIGGEYIAQEVQALDSPTGATEISLTPIGAGAEDLVLNPDSPIFAGTRRAQPTPVYKEWWFWTIIGVAAAGATTGIVLLSTSQSGGGSGPTGGVTVNLNQF